MSKTTVGELYDSCSVSYGRRTAIRYKETSFTYREMGENAYRLANAFLALGLKKGDRVAFLMANCPEYIFAEYALAKIGGVRVPLAVLLNSDDHIYMMNHSESVVLVYHEKLTERVLAIDEHGQAAEVSIPAERALTVFVDKRELVTLMTLGAAPELLVLGYLRNQRLVDSVRDIESINMYREAVGDRADLLFGGWECELSPTGQCVYDLDSDGGDDDCLYCHGPNDRQ
jgi:non-ribosomal peptide synthetase component F